MAEIRHGVLKSFNSGTYIATVQLAGSLPVYLDVPTSRDIASGDMLAGRRVALLFLSDASNPNDAVVCAVFV